MGYSGGAAVAVLLAARRHDVGSVRTLAGNLDLEAVNRHHRVGPLTGSMDPMDAAKSVSGIPQMHFIAEKDSVVPAAAIENFLNASGNERCIQIRKVSEATHHEGWTQKWPELVRLPVFCSE